MVTFRRFKPEDLNKISMCNMDPLTETYDASFYLQYYAKWPQMFIVAEDDRGNIVAYSKLINFARVRSTCLNTKTGANMQS